MKFSLKAKLITFLCIVFSLIFGGTAWYTTSVLKDSTIANFEERYEKLVFSYATRVETILSSATHLADQLADVVGKSNGLDDAELKALLAKIIARDTVLFAAGIAFEPYAFLPNKHHHGFFIYEKGGENAVIDFGLDSTRYNYRDTSYNWYNKPVMTGKPYWSSPFYSSLLKGVKVVTYSAPIMRHSKCIGVVVVDFSLGDMNGFLISNFKSYSNRFLVIDGQATYISHPDSGRILNKNLLTDLNSVASEQSRKILVDSLNLGRNGKLVIDDKTGERKIHAFYSYISLNGWRVILYEYEDELFASINSVFLVSILFFVAGLIVVLIFVYFGTGNALAPLQTVRKFLAKIVKGDYKGELLINSSDEFNELATDLNLMQATLSQREEELKEINRELENKVADRTKELRKTAELLAKSNDELGIRNKLISDSINYAKKIQEAILPEDTHLIGLLDEYFLIYLPKDVVSGDFYWVEKVDRKTVIVLADCTGHGVPGAFMSIIGKLLLNEIILRNQVTSPAEILEEMDERIIEELKKRQHSGSIDGMDMGICVVDEIDGSLTFAGAYRPLIYISEGNLFEIKGVSRSVGDLKRKERKFTETVLFPKSDDSFFLFSDGIVDQNNDGNKKLGSNKLKELFSTGFEKPLPEQKELVLAAFLQHRGTEEQRDDVTVIGFRVNRRHPVR